MTASLSVSQEFSSSCEDNAAVPHEADPEFEANRVIHYSLYFEFGCGAWTSLDRQDATLEACGTYAWTERALLVSRMRMYVCGLFYIHTFLAPRFKRTIRNPYAPSPGITTLGRGPRHTTTFK